jgi:hypothetical protein
MNVARSAVFMLAAPRPGPKRSWSLKIEQNYGKNHTLGRFRISLGTPSKDGSREHQFDRKLAEWTRAEEARAVRWEPLRPVDARSNVPLLAVQDDKSVFVHGDMTKSDTYELQFGAGGQAGRGDPSRGDRRPAAPKGGPGRFHYGAVRRLLAERVTVQADANR